MSDCRSCCWRMQHLPSGDLRAAMSSGLMSSIAVNSFLNDVHQLPDQQADVSRALPHQLQDPVFRPLLPPHRAGRLLQRPLRVAGHEPPSGPDGQAADPPHTGGAGVRVRELLQEIPAHSEEGRVVRKRRAGACLQPGLTFIPPR